MNSPNGSDLSQAIDMEKTMATDEQIETCKSLETIDAEIHGVDAAERRKILWKIDRRLISSLGLMVAISLLDRTNLGNAMIAGMSAELHMSVGDRYSIALLMFFVPYVLLELPSAVLVKKLGPRKFLPCIVATWGILMLCFGFAHNWETITGLRVILGILEAGLFPGIVLLIQSWYCRYDVHQRLSVFYLISIVGSSFSGLLSSAFMQMGGVGGYRGWRYIFIWEGVLTVLIAGLAALLMIDFPQKINRTTGFLKPGELDYILSELEKDRGDVEDPPFRWSEYLRCGLDLKIWAYGLIYLANTTGAYALAFFLPIILQHKLGFSTVVSQLLTTPPYVFAGIFMWFQGWLGDKYHIRGPIIIWNALQNIIGFTILTWTKSVGSQMLGIFLVAAGCNATIPAVLTYQANNIRGTWKRAFSSASIIAFGGTGGIVGSLVYRSQDSPRYIPGISASIGLMILTLILTTALMVYFRVMNGRADRGGRALEGLVGFRYTY